MATCYLCNQIIGDNEDVIPYKNHKKVHRICFEHIMGAYSVKEHQETERKEAEKKQAKKEIAVKIKPVEVENEGLSEEEYQFKRKYYSYLREQLGDVLSKHYAITDRFIKKYDYTFSGLYQTLKYMHDVLEKEFREESNIIALIPYHYEEAVEFYTDVAKCNEQNENKDISKMYRKRTIKVKKGQDKKKGKMLEF